jgi:hypothetical protein
VTFLIDVWATLEYGESDDKSSSIEEINLRCLDQTGDNEQAESSSSDDDLKATFSAKSWR